MSENDKGPDQVGYKRPPQATQFKPGQSGNAKGRPKGAKNFATVIEKELAIQVAVTENGKRRLISKREAVAKQLVNKAANGDPRAIPLLLNEARVFEAADDRPGLATSLATPEDELVMQSILQRIRHMPLTGEPPQAPQADASASPADYDPSRTDHEREA